MRTFFAGFDEIIEWYWKFAPKYDEMAWQTEIFLAVMARREGVLRNSGGYPARFVRDTLKRFVSSKFESMAPTFIGSGRKKAVYGFGKKAVLKLALERNAMSSDLAIYRFSENAGLTCLQRIYGVSSQKSSMLCEYAPPPEEWWFIKNFGMSCGKICRLLGICSKKEPPATDMEFGFLKNVAEKRSATYKSLYDMRTLTSEKSLGADISGNEGNWGLAKRDGETVPVLIDCGC